MDTRICRKTQDTLGKIIVRPPLTDKLLAKPPFRFLHDIITSVVNTTGFMYGLYNTEEQNSDNVKDKDSKIGFLQKAIDIVSLVTGKQLSVRPSKVVAGHEPEKTNEFLQILAEAINKKVDNDVYVQRVLNGKDVPKKREQNKERDKSKEKSSSKQPEKEEPKKSKERGDKKESSKPQVERHKNRDENENKPEEKDRQKSRTDEKERRRSRTEEKPKSKSDERERHRSKVEEREKHQARGEDRQKERHSTDKEKSSRKTIKDDTKENEKPPRQNKDENIEETAAPRKLTRPTSAKGSRHKREDTEISPVPQAMQLPSKEEKQTEQPEVPLRPSEPLPLTRPSSARPAPPKQRKSEVVTDPIIQLGSGKPANVITDDGQNSDEDEQFIVEDTTPLQSKDTMTKTTEIDAETEHGGLVNKILETKKEMESAAQVVGKTKVEIETPLVNSSAYQKQRQLVENKIAKFQVSIQTLTKSANPLGKIMDYIQEDLDSMQKELGQWKQENREHTSALKREKEITEKAVEPLKLQLATVDEAINDQLDIIAMVKANIIHNGKRIETMLHSIAQL